ncbi:MFS transporter [Pseudomonas panipatensis]|uniref:MFS transporter, AAHS family, 4-hydroxybenzoate transporter n=1 Tax=Pseudomonas panipatensis TaxID=428992 RepID=A0A1G8GD79_9PSED|nr:aromatic acid/H+ symport family MFS transporter [Pseudomonas panipatensis]SDH92329.1 MFS transporter, AAHS family, 4-hydroxybenzoate transporter [Pseudomonas panipatensis]SMP44035.1 MFS transporter, AAHS family, 4-hydroxybenzoate transporter [Pseudomonas panipatensis]
MNTQRAIDVRQLINDRPLGAYQLWVVFLGFLIIGLDGLDVAIMGFIAPQLKADWNLSTQALGPVLSAALVGLAAGALIAGPLADRFGRRIVLVSSVFFFGFWTLATAFSSDVTQMVILRLLTGLGLGAAMPNASTLVSEFAPDKRRSFLVTVAFAGFSAGAAGGGFLSAWMIPAFGWHSMLLFGGALPLLVAPLLWLLLPESISFLVAQGAPAARVRRIVERIAPGASSAQSHFCLPSAPVTAKTSVGLILSPHYRFGTLMVWAGYFLALFLVYLFSSWLPMLVKEGGGYGVGEAALVTALFQIGGPAGALFVGWSMDRFNPYKVLVLAFAGSAALIFCIGQATTHFLLLCVFACGIGFGLNGTSVGMNALATCFYPTQARATGASWMSGIGRFGAILSAFAGAQMMALGWSFPQMFAALTLPALLGALVIAAKGLARQRRPQALGAVSR